MKKKGPKDPKGRKVIHLRRKPKSKKPSDKKKGPAEITRLRRRGVPDKELEETREAARILDAADRLEKQRTREEGKKFLTPLQIKRIEQLEASAGEVGNQIDWESTHELFHIICPNKRRKVGRAIIGGSGLQIKVKKGKDMVVIERTNLKPHLSRRIRPGPTRDVRRVGSDEEANRLFLQLREEAIREMEKYHKK